MGSCISKKSDVTPNIILPSQKFGQNNALLDKWTEQQVRLLNTKFNEYKTTEGLDFNDFERLIIENSYIPKPALKNLFKMFSIAEFDVLNFRNFCILIAQIFLSNKKDKSELIFKIFNQSKSGTWTENEKNAFELSYKEFLRLKQRNSNFSYSSGNKISEFIEWAMKNLDMTYIMRPFELIPSPDREKKIISEYMQELNPFEGLSVCLLSSVWWETWKNFVRFEAVDLASGQNKSINIGDRPVSIDNSVLLLSSNTLKLKPNLRQEKDFVIVTEQVWKVLHEWYEGGPKILRVFQLSQNKTPVLDLYPPIFKIVHVQTNGLASPDNYLVLRFSRSDTFQTVLNQAAKNLKKPVEYSRLWVKTGETLKVANLNDPIDSPARYSDEILFETAVNDRGKIFWPRELVKSKVASFPSNTLTASSSNSEESKRNTEIRKMSYIKAGNNPGIVGLNNLGNTCYFNCIIQALVHTPLLQEFFSSSNVTSYMHKNLNVTNSLSIELSSLCKEIWAGSTQRLNPIKLYKSFTERFSMFDDKNQHDCHEFLSIFLDALHEELRREGEADTKNTVILDNPESFQVELQESEKQWQMLQGNKGSIITDICAGQTKTTLTCASCGSQRVIFEIYTNLSLPIPYFNFIPLYITIVPLSNSISKIAIIATKHTKVKEIIDEISGFSNIPVHNILLFESTYKLSYRTLDNSPDLFLSSLGVVSKTELYASQARKTIEECEEQGRRVRPYEKQTFTVNSQIDILHSNKRWVSGQIKEIKGDKFLVEYDYIEEKDWKTLGNISNFRSQTSYKDPVVFTIFINHVSSSSKKKLGFPMALTIGSWYTFEDLFMSASALVIKMCSKDLKVILEPFKILVINSSNLKCGLCENSANCSGCQLPRNKNEVRSLFYFKKIQILAEWNEKYFSEEIKYDSSVINAREREKTASMAIDIETCLNEFTKEEKLEMNCEKCKKNNMKMKMEIWRTPDIFILSFKRFHFSNGFVEKINSFVNFTFADFEISQYVKSSESSKKFLSTAAGQNSYDLYAVVLHSGNISSGHYTSLIKMQSGWFLFDDDCLLELKESPENSNLLAASYLLMYRRRRFSSSNVINLTYNSV